MSRTCNGNGTCCPPVEPLDEVTRRDFLKALGVGGLSVYGAEASAEAAAAAPAPPGHVTSVAHLGAYPTTPPRLYEGEHLQAVAMPLGGIGTGTLWLDGQGRLRVWQIFNNDTEVRVPNSFLALRVQPAGGQADIRVLQTVREDGFAACPSLTFEGGYPIARLTFDTGLPVSAQLEAFSPFIPTDTANSSLPCVILRVTVRNDGDQPADVTLLSTLQNAVGYEGQGDLNGVRHARFGGNTNRVIRERGMTGVDLTVPAEPPLHGFLRPRGSDGQLASKRPLLWLPALEGPADMAKPDSPALGGAEALTRLADQPAVIVAAGAHLGFFEALQLARDQRLLDKYLTVFEDFEGPTYDGWTVEGQGFGTGPSKGTHPGQQEVSGFVGKGLVNTYLPNDAPQGRLISRPFTLDRRYVGFLLGGGKHQGQTCLNLRVEGRTVRTAQGKNNERLEPQSWDVTELVGKEAQLEIVDAHSGAWGHINVDHLVFSDAPPENLLRLSGSLKRVAEMLPAEWSNPIEVKLETPVTVRSALNGLPLGEPWTVSSYLRFPQLAGAKGIRVLATLPTGDPVVIAAPWGEGSLVLPLTDHLPWSWARAMFCHLAGLDPKAVAFETTRGGFGSMCLATTAKSVQAVAAWTDPQELAGQLLRGELVGDDEGPTPATPPGQTVNAALAAPFSLAPGESRTESFVYSWHFPNVERFGHQGNHYCTVFRSALEAARYVANNLPVLTERTFLYHTTLYASNLPEEFLDAVSSQAVIIRSPVCWRSADGYFAGYEGAYRCCPLNCTHVWNYAQTHARLFPELGRNMRVSNFLTYLHDDGETSHREHKPHRAFADGHCACIEAALREHQLSADNAFLARLYPNLKKAMEWFIRTYDPDEEGVTRGHQWNTYDTAVSGLNTFIGSQYLSALAAAEQMAAAMDDAEFVSRWRALRQRGMQTQNEQLWNGSYYLQLPEEKAARDYNNGCHSDQLLGQWWAHQLGLGYLYPPDRVKEACRSIFRNNFKADFTGLPQIPRRYVDDGDGGLYMCTWPQDDRPKSFILYALEAWTGIEYSTASLLVYEGLLDEARALVQAARARYDGRPRNNLNSGGGVCGAGNPFQELECGKFYARAMSSWSLLLAAQGALLNGPAGLVGFKPNWSPDDHRSFFTVPEGWGLFIQRRADNTQQSRLELRHGRLTLNTLVFAAAGKVADCTVLHNGKPVSARWQQDQAGEVRVTLVKTLAAAAGDAVEVRLET